MRDLWAGARQWLERGNLRRQAARAERLLFFDDATFADASRSDGLAPIAVVPARSISGFDPKRIPVGKSVELMEARRVAGTG
jgi:hypothetical protein